uniref:RNA helicase n=1 Tax=Enterobius vermicularis TaxID=51028 RepID=A0A0N4UUM5_ENTVE
MLVLQFQWYFPKVYAAGRSITCRSFDELNLGKWLCSQLKELSVTSPTPVQAHCIPHVLSGMDVIGCSKTGTGKTLAFTLPILHQLAIDPYGIFALVITPTRELAFQIGDQFNALGISIGLKTAVIVGGRDHVAQANELASDPEGVGLLLSKIKFLVLDEADRILEGQYANSLKSILRVLPNKRQTLLFSATITSALSHLHQVSMRKPYFFKDKEEVATVERLDQKYVLCPSAVKDAYLVYVVKVFHERHLNSSILIFSHTCKECQALAMMFSGLGFEVGSLHSQILQKHRLSALSKFRSGRIRILICTDVAARGLDIQHVDLVINHNVPRDPKIYIHRVGRSARAGRFGGAVTFVTQYDVTLLQEIEKLIGRKLEQLTVSDKKVKQYVTQVLVTKREAEIKLEQQNFGERKEINRRKEMILSGVDPEQAAEELKEERTKSFDCVTCWKTPWRKENLFRQAIYKKRRAIPPKTKRQKLSSTVQPEP